MVSRCAGAPGKPGQGIVVVRPTTLLSTHRLTGIPAHRFTGSPSVFICVHLWFGLRQGGPCMDFGIQLGNLDWQRLKDVAREAEELGFTSIMTPDHLIHEG